MEQPAIATPQTPKSRSAILNPNRGGLPRYQRNTRQTVASLHTHPPLPPNSHALPSNSHATGPGCPATARSPTTPYPGTHRIITSRPRASWEAIITLGTPAIIEHRGITTTPRTDRIGCNDYGIHAFIHFRHPCFYKISPMERDITLG